MSRSIVTKDFRLGPSVHARKAVMRRAARFWMAGALPLIVLMALGVMYDTRMLFVAAALVFIIFPTLLFVGWYSLLTRPWAVASLALQNVTFEPDGDIVVGYPLPSKPKASDADSLPPVRQPSDMVIEAATVNGAAISGEFLMIGYADSRDLIIPLGAFAAQADVAEILRRYSPN